jgi:hypothetical protein
LHVAAARTGAILVDDDFAALLGERQTMGKQQEKQTDNP